ncbi:MAG: hypothetical protein NVS3B21_03490 [Acidimicrobiales bacterium]
MAPPSPPAVILIADDSAVVRHVVRSALEEHGHEIIEAVDGQAALDELADRRPDVILLDIEMPRLDGLSTLDRIQASPDLAGVPVLLLTGHSDATQIVSGLERGAHDYLAKPFQAAELAARVGAALRMARLYARLARRNAELDHFAAKAAHDLKSPLTVIKGNADILEMGWDRLDPQTRAEQLKAMARASVRAGAMVDDLLTLARLDEGNDAEPAVTDPRAVIEDVLGGAAHGPSERVTVSGSFASVVMPTADLAAAIRNLVGNARHYGRDSEGTLTLSIEGEVGPSNQRIKITDGGPGIPEDQRAKVFDAFYSVPGSRSFNAASTGVGLSIVQRAIERWGGAASVEAAQPSGARFVLDIPRCRPG